MKKRALIPILVLAPLLWGCLTQENRHVFYLDPDGAVTWTVFEEGVRSTEKDPAARSEEERRFLDQARRSEHPVAAALDRLRPLALDTRLVRDERPYALVTQARFESVARVLEEFLRGLGLDATASLEREGEATRLTVRFREPSDPDPRGEEERDEVLPSLVESPEAYRFVLTEGEFVRARGFRLEQDGTAAVMLEPEGEQKDDSSGFVTYELVWTAAN